METIRSRVTAALGSCGRGGSQVRLLAVSKQVGVEKIKRAYQLGIRDFGESYLREAEAKLPRLHDLREARWHYIGGIQSNKAARIAKIFDWVQSVDRQSIITKLQKHAPEGKRLQVCIQVNLDGEEQKFGCRPDQVGELLQEIRRSPGLEPRGLMAIPLARNPEPAFVELARIFREISERMARLEHWDTLSMGMSGDFEKAITQGATMIRLGTALFGERTG